MIVEEKVSKASKDLYLSLLKEGKSVYLTARGMSMYPFIKNADRIKIVPTNAETIKIGDIVAVDRKDKGGAWFFVHRVVKITKDKGEKVYFTKGDARRSLDVPISKESIIGRITEVERRGVVINLESSLERRLNSIITELSCRYPKIRHFFAKYMILFIKCKLFLFKIKNRLEKGNPLIFNSKELLLICARKSLDQELEQEAINLIKEGLRWGNFCELAGRGGVTVLVYNVLRTIEPYAHIPQFVFDKLKSGYLLITSRVVSHHRELIEVLELFAKKDIPVLPLKGTVLSRRLYGDIAARGLSIDFDLLIKEKDKDGIKNILEEIGYHCDGGEAVKKWQWQYNFFKSEATIIEPYWDVTMINRNPGRIKGLWKGTKLIKESNINYYEFKEEELLLYLSVHLVNSGDFRKLKYSCDINELLNKYKDILDWNSVIEKARRWRLSNSLYTTLRLSRELFNSGVPDEVLKKLRPNFLKLILIELFVNKGVMLRSGLRRRLIDSFLSYIFFELIEARSIKEYLSIARRVAFPPREAMGDRSYISRIFKGLLKLSRRLFFTTPA